MAFRRQPKSFYLSWPAFIIFAAVHYFLRRKAGCLLYFVFRTFPVISYPDFVDEARLHSRIHFLIYYFVIH
jgi:hypothetical protein